jgi:hypothetical protein
MQDTLGFIVVNWIITGIPLRSIQKKAGLPGWPLLFLFVPVFGFVIVLGWMAMTNWPETAVEEAD